MSKTLPHVLEDSTQIALRERYNQLRSWRNVERALGVNISFAALAAAAKGQPGAISADGERNLRRAMGLPPLSVAAEPCPTCGNAHNLDAAGKPLDCCGQVVSAVILPVGARIVRPSAGYAHRRRWRPDLTMYAGRISAQEIRQLVAQFLEQK